MHHLLPTALAAALAVSAFGQAALPPSFAQNKSDYTISQGGKQLGQAQFSVAPAAGGEEFRSTGEMKLNDFSYLFHHTALVDSQFNLVHDALDGSVHGTRASAKNVEFTTATNPTGREFNIGINADGTQTSNTVDRHQNLVLLPDLDPGALTLMVHFALQQPRSAWVLLPKESGILAPAQYRLGSDLRGTFAGQPIMVKHAVVTIGEENAVVVELFFSSDVTLLEGDLNAQNLQVVRDRFRLEKRPEPVAPPAGPAEVPQ